jgi:hypothetical protein
MHLLLAYDIRLNPAFHLFSKQFVVQDILFGGCLGTARRQTAQEDKAMYPESPVLSITRLPLSPWFTKPETSYSP